MLSSNEVVTAYRLVLGRTPESQDVVSHNIEHETLETLFQNLIASEEFLIRLQEKPSLRDALIPALQMISPPQEAYPRRKLAWRRQEARVG